MSPDQTPTAAPKPSIRRIGFILTVFLLLGSLAAIGYWMLFSHFALYDDEGYILISAREYFLHGELYQAVYAQYGPAFYVLMDIVQRAFGAPVDHTMARLLTLGLWLGTAGSCALLVWRESRSRSLSLFTLSATFLYLYFITDEPFHPGSLIIFILAATLVIATELLRTGRLTGAAVTLGSSGALLFLIKINVGIFFLTSTGAWAGMNAISDRVRTKTKPWIAGALLLLALALMHTLVRESWVQIYLVLFACGTVALTRATHGEALIKPRQAGAFIGASVSTVLFVLVLVWMRGTAVESLLEGVLLGPLRHPGNYSYAVDWRPGSLAIAGLSLALAILFPWIGRKFSDETATRLIVVLRLVQAAALLTGFALLMNFRAVGAIFSYVAPLIWIWIVPLKGVEQTPTHRICRRLLALILLLQYLHAYPVGGSQESWGTFLFIPLVALGLGDVRRWLGLRAATATRSRKLGWSSWPAMGTLIVAVVIAKVGWTAHIAQRDFATREPLRLPGAESIRLPESLGATYRILALNAVVHADRLFSLPGMFSFNLWTSLPAPTTKNTTLWMTLLNPTEQAAIIHALEQTPRAGIVVQESLIDLMRTNRVPLQGALWDYLQKNYSAAFKTDDFAFWVKTGRVIAPLNVATVHRRTSPQPTGTEPDTRIDFCLVHDGTPISAIAVRAIGPTPRTTLTLDSHNAHVTLTPINRAGDSLAPTADTPWPVSSKGLIRVSVHFNRGELTLYPASAILHLQGPHGENLSEVWIGK